MSQEEIIKLFDEFINEKGIFFAFKKWIEERGHTLDEIGIQDD